MKKLLSLATVLFGIAAMVLAFVAGSSVFAQTSNGTITGVVRDASGAVISGAKVVVTNESTASMRNATTSAVGTFRIESVEPGPYTVHVEKPGFKTFDLKQLDVRPSIITSSDIALGVASANAEVTVETANTATLDVDSGGITSTIGEQELKTIPIFSMNPVELVQALPGVQLINNGGFSNGIDISVNGARPRANNYLIDGQDDNDNGIEGQALQANIPDMYSNVIALTNSYSAEYGRGGGAVVNLITKSGTNQFHGSAYELYSGSGLNAIDGQSRGAGITKTRFDQHQVAFTIGGLDHQEQTLRLRRSCSTHVSMARKRRQIYFYRLQHPSQRSRPSIQPTRSCSFNTLDRSANTI